MADKIDQLKTKDAQGNDVLFDIDLPPDATPSIASLTTRGNVTVGGSVIINLSSSGLPNTYTELTYISSSGPQYINTGYKITSESMKIEFKCDFSGTSSINGMTLFGSNGSVYDLVPYHSDGYGDGVFQHWVGSSGGVFPVTYSMTSPNVVEYTLNNGTISCTMNGVMTSSTYNGSIQSGQNFYIWGKNASGSSAERGYGYKLYYFKLYDNGVLKRNLIPCFRNSDNVVGLYDTVNSTFYTNSGSGTFNQGVIAGTTEAATIIDLSSKQDTLVSGTNIKTINNNSLLGSGNINISGGGLTLLYAGYCSDITGSSGTQIGSSGLFAISGYIEDLESLTGSVSSSDKLFIEVIDGDAPTSTMFPLTPGDSQYNFYGIWDTTIDYAIQAGHDEMNIYKLG